MMNLANQVIQTCHFLTKPKPSHFSTTALYVILPTVFLFKHQSKTHYNDMLVVTIAFIQQLGLMWKYVCSLNVLVFVSIVLLDLLMVHRRLRHTKPDRLLHDIDKLLRFDSLTAAIWTPILGSIQYIHRRTLLIFRSQSYQIRSYT